MGNWSVVCYNTIYVVLLFISAMNVNNDFLNPRRIAWFGVGILVSNIYTAVKGK